MSLERFEKTIEEAVGKPIKEIRNELIDTSIPVVDEKTGPDLISHEQVNRQVDEALKSVEKTENKPSQSILILYKIGLIRIHICGYCGE